MKKLITILIISAATLAACKDSAKNINAIMEPAKANTTTYPVKNISISINRSAAEVYQFASNPEHFPKWVAFIKSMTKQEDIWIGKTDAGEIKIKFAPVNDFGIIDHEVTLSNGETVYVPMRAIANNKGCEFTFTLLRMPNRTDQEFNDDAKAVTADLQKLKEILEQ
jgi:hypothetical protein